MLRVILLMLILSFGRASESAGQRNPDPSATSEADAGKIAEAKDVSPSSTADPAKSAATTEIKPGGKPVRSQAEREADFKRVLTGATLQGVWQMTSKDAKDQTLTDPRAESYRISDATKLEGDRWIISARIQYGDKDVTLPVPVRVVWAEDTPVITLDDLTLPMLGTYSARVMFYQGFYCGTWFCGGKGYGGVMSGRIVHEEEKAAANIPTSTK